MGNVIPREVLEVVRVKEEVQVGLRVGEGTEGKKMEKKKMGINRAPAATDCKVNGVKERW